MPLKNKDFKDLDLNILFLGWFLKWDPQEIYYYSTKNSGYILDDYKSDGSYGRYSSVDDKMEYLHFYCSYIKFGIGRCLDTSQEIRNGHITREEGVNLCKKFEGEFQKDMLKIVLILWDLLIKKLKKLLINLDQLICGKRKKQMEKKTGNILSHFSNF